MLKAIGMFRAPLAAAVEYVRPIRNIASVTVTTELHPYKLFKLTEGPNTTTTCTTEEALNYYETMQRIRRMETTIGSLYKDKAIRGFCHLYSGQEAIAVGIETTLNPGDAIITAYRCHGFLLTRGESIAKVIGELAGKSIGNVRGKGGSMHMYGKDFYGGNGIVGAQVPLGAGIALKLQRSGTNNLCVTLFGDGAANQGQVFEAFNMAKLWNLPCIFICENNRYAMGTSSKRCSANTSYYTRGDYIPGIWVDGMDILTVREAMRFATNWCRAGNGPILLETETYRYYGHSMSDPGTSYRTRDEVQAVRRERDPIITMGHFIISSGLATEQDIKAIDKKVRKEVEDAVEQVHASPFPELETAYYHVHSKNPDDFSIRGRDFTEKFIPKA